jgi:DNA-binding transcriptional ArsR family regulator
MVEAQLAGLPAPLPVRVEAREAVEFVMSMTVSGDRVLDTRAGDDADRAPRRDAARVLRTVSAVLDGDGSPLARLLPIALGEQDPSVAAFIGRLSGADPDALALRMAGFDDADPEWQGAIGAARDGDFGGLTALAERGNAEAMSARTAARVLRVPAEELKRRLVQATVAWAETEWPRHAAASGPALRREARRARRALADGADIAAFTNGVEWASWPASVDRAGLYPTLVGQPWVTHLVADGALIVVYPVPDEVTSSLASQRNRAWRRLGSALRQPDALAILGALGQSDRTIDELAGHVEREVPMVRRQLVALREAGLVSVDAGTHRYRQRREPVPIGRLLDGAERARVDGRIRLTAS